MPQRAEELLYVGAIFVTMTQGFSAPASLLLGKHRRLLLPSALDYMGLYAASAPSWMQSLEPLQVSSKEQ